MNRTPPCRTGIISPKTVCNQPISLSVLLILFWVLSSPPSLSASVLHGPGPGGPDFGKGILHIFTYQSDNQEQPGCPASDYVGLKLEQENSDSRGWRWFGFDSMSEPFNDNRLAVANPRCEPAWVLIDLESWRIVQEFASREAMEAYFPGNRIAAPRILGTEEWKHRHTWGQAIRFYLAQDIFFNWILVPYVLTPLIAFLLAHYPVTWLLQKSDRYLLRRDFFGGRSAFKSFWMTFVILFSIPLIIFAINMLSVRL